MTDASFTFGDLRCFADPSDARHYYFLPIAPDRQRGGDQRPMITMLDVGSSGHVMFTATWGARPASVNALKRQIAAGHQDPDTSRIRLSFAPIASPACHVLLGDGSGAFRTIATSATSRVPPYDALFSLPVPSQSLDQVRAAVRGREDFLAVEYVAELRIPAAGTAAFRADAARLISWLRSERHGGASLRALLEEAVQAGLATVTVSASERLGAEVAGELFDRVLTQVADVAPRWMAHGGAGVVEVEASIERGAPEHVRACADIGRIVAGGSLQSS